MLLDLWKEGESKKDRNIESVKKYSLVFLIYNSILKSEIMLIDWFCGYRLHAGFYA